MWISVKIGLPPTPSPAGQCVRYMVTNGIGVSIARFNSNQRWLDFCGEVTHWALIPSPPTTEESGVQPTRTDNKPRAAICCMCHTLTSSGFHSSAGRWWCDVCYSKLSPVG